MNKILRPWMIHMAMVSVLIFAQSVEALEVNITPELGEIQVKHGKEMVKVSRNQDTNAVIDPDFAKTSRKCPPFCAQPMEVAAGVKTIGEVELIQFMAKKLNDGSGVLVDARTPDWYAKGTIPGSINVPYTDLNKSLGAEEIAISDAMGRFGAVKKDGGYDFSKAKELVLWCNGPWCEQSPKAIHGLIELGYPAAKLIYYRGGMQEWRIFGLTVLPPAKE